MNISTPDVLGRQANCVVRNVGCLKRNQTISRDAYAKFFKLKCLIKFKQSTHLNARFRRAAEQTIMLMMFFKNDGPR